MPNGPLIIISGPAGSGKSTLVRRVLPAFQPRLRLSVSATTRAPRVGEQDGVDYHFWTEGRLAAARGELEHVGEYQHGLVNDNLEVAAAQLRDLIAGQFRE